MSFDSPVAGKKSLVHESYPYYFAFEGNADATEVSSSSSSSSSSASAASTQMTGCGGIASVDGKRKMGGSTNSSSVVDLTVIHGRPSMCEVSCIVFFVAFDGFINHLFLALSYPQKGCTSFLSRLGYTNT